VCVKTGCLLEVNFALHWGDLHCLGPGVLIFNAVRHNSEPLAVDPADYSLEDCKVTYDGPLFERVGVFVLLPQCAIYNEPLLAHFAAWRGSR